MKINNFDNIIKDESGAVAIITAVVLFFVLIGIAALAIDIGRVATTKNELQNAADAAALAGAGKLGEIYRDMPQGNHATFDCDINDCSEIYNVARGTASEHLAAGEYIINSDVRIGQWDGDIFDERSDQPDAVKVILGKGGDSGNVAITNFFARFLGFDTADASAKATAALTGVDRFSVGKVNAPFGLSELLVKDFCGDNPPVYNTVEFRPSNSCAKHHNFLWPSSTSAIRTLSIETIMNHKLDPPHPNLTLTDGEDWFNDIDFRITQHDKDAEKLFESEPIPDDYFVGQKFDFTHGRVSALFKSGSYLCTGDTSILNSNDACFGKQSYDDVNINAGNFGDVSQNNSAPSSIEMLYDYFRYRDDDDDDNIWTTYAPIYKEDGNSMSDCGEGSGLIEIVGFIEVEVERINPPPDSSYDVQLNCNPEFNPGRGTGITKFPFRGFIPNLVE